VRDAVDDARVRVAPLADTLSEASPVSDVSDPAFARLQRTIREVFPETLSAPYLVVGATDARYYTALSPNVYRFLPVWAKPDDLRRFHGVDERVSVENYAGSIRFYTQFVRDFAGERAG
jgi:carboxypeptidase PM20D1